MLYTEFSTDKGDYTPDAWGIPRTPPRLLELIALSVLKLLVLWLVRSGERTVPLLSSVANR